MNKALCVAARYLGRRPSLYLDKPFAQKELFMRVRNSIKSAKVRDKNNRVIRRRGRLYVINKRNPRMKTRQG